MSLATTGMIIAGAFAMAGGLLAYAISTSRKLGKADAKNAELQRKIDYLAAALRSRGADPDLDDLVLPVPKGHNGAAA